MKILNSLTALLLALLVIFPHPVFARGGYHSGGYRSSGRSYSSHSSSSRSYGGSLTKTTTSSFGGHTSRYTYGVPRDSSGCIKRSESAKKDFMKETGYPNGRKGYVIDHVVPLKRDGADSPSNMQWQTKEAAKAKDKIE